MMPLSNGRPLHSINPWSLNDYVSLILHSNRRTMTLVSSHAARCAQGQGDEVSADQLPQG